MAKSKQSAVLLILVVAVAAIAAIKFSLHPKQLTSAEIETARSKGNPQAKIQITEFIDFECPACANGVGILKKYFEDYPNQIHVQVKYFPLTNAHRHAMTSALFSECAARQGKFWQLHELMMAQQASWSQLLSPDPIFIDMAKDVGIDIGQLNSCIASEDARKTINDEKSLGQSLGIQSTPTYFINGKMVVGTKSLTEALNALLSPAPAS